ncbi:MAG: DUF1365 domain-containing protein [Chromatiales bacterium]|nr:DUF1365 domain-containing protein [Gammaproteobacteria bacterium]MBW6475543.1 DUF1365 domain-containing protein [Chromatiales bacterium]
MANLASAIYRGTVMHRRLRPVAHRFRYAVSAWLFDLDELAQLDRLRLFSNERFNLFSFYARDHGDGSDTPLKQQIKTLLAEQGVDTGDGAIRLLCYPRMFGYVFNPLSVFYCHDETDKLRAIIYEVSNTFSQRHAYLIPLAASQVDAGEGGSRAMLQQQCDKLFYVSPFMPMQTHYRFRLLPPAEQVTVLIQQHDTEGRVFDASFSGRRVALDNRAVLKTFLRHPLMTLKVIVGIHWEALRLWRKGMAIQPRPEQPRYQVTRIDAQVGVPGS